MSIRRFANQQLWPRAVTVLRTGLITTRGHPLHGPVEAYANSLPFRDVGSPEPRCLFAPDEGKRVLGIA